MKSAVVQGLDGRHRGAALLAGCASIRAHKGAVIDPQLATAIQPGVDNKASVEKTLGRPTFTGQFTPNDWYYVSRDTDQFAFRNPRVTDQTVLHVRFDQAGNVAAVEQTGKELIANDRPDRAARPRRWAASAASSTSCSAISARSAQPGLPGSKASDR